MKQLTRRGVYRLLFSGLTTLMLQSSYQSATQSLSLADVGKGARLRIAKILEAGSAKPSAPIRESEWLTPVTSSERAIAKLHQAVSTHGTDYEIKLFATELMQLGDFKAPLPAKAVWRDNGEEMEIVIAGEILMHSRTLPVLIIGRKRGAEGMLFRLDNSGDLTHAGRGVDGVSQKLSIESEAVEKDFEQARSYWLARLAAGELNSPFYAAN